MKTFRLFILLLVAAIVASPVAFAAERGGARVHAILVIASNEKVPTDRKLSRYEDKLKSSLRFASYRYVSEGSASVSADGTASLSLPNNNTLRLTGDKANEGVTVQHNGPKVFIPKDATVVLGGRAAGDKGEVYAVIVEVN